YKFKLFSSEKVLEKGVNCYYYSDRTDKDSIFSFYINSGMSPMFIYSNNILYHFYSDASEKLYGMKILDTISIKKVIQGNLDHHMICIPFLQCNFFESYLKELPNVNIDAEYSLTVDSLNYIVTRKEIINTKFNEVRTEKLTINKFSFLLSGYSEEYSMYEGRQFREYEINILPSSQLMIPLEDRLADLLKEYKPDFKNPTTH
ncbi:MAG: hypothetical protein ABI772_04510, partial [Bacteroidota bacterium]